MTMASLRIAEFDGPAAEWDAFAQRQLGFTHYHRYAWRGVMERVFAHEGVYLAARTAEGELAGVLPMVRMRSALFGRQLCSMPFLNYGGPLGDATATRALTNAAVALAQRERAKLEFRGRTELPLDLPCATHKIAVTLALEPGGSEVLWRRLPSAVRNQVRKPMKAGVTMRFGADQVEPFFHVFARNMRDLGTPTHTLRLFQAVADTFPNDALFGCAYVDGRPAAGGCAVQWGSEIEMVWGSALREYNRTHAPNMLMYWSFIERSCDLGLSVFNFGRSTPESGPHRFKRQWGGRDEPLFWYGTHVDAHGDEGTAERWGPKVWRHLPLAVANRLGPVVRRAIPA